MSLVPTTMWGQGTLSPKAAITISGNGMKKAKAQGVDNKKVSAYVTINDNITSWQELGLMPIAEDGNTATVRLSLNELKALAGKEGVEYIQLSSGVQQMLDVARKEAGTEDIHKGTSLPLPYTGKGLVVGVVDASTICMQHSATLKMALSASRRYGNKEPQSSKVLKHQRNMAMA